MATHTRKAHKRTRADSGTSASNKERPGRTYFPGKIPTPTTITLTQVGKDIADAAEKTCRASRSDVVEALLRKHGADLTQRDLLRLSRAAVATEAGGI